MYSFYNDRDFFLTRLHPVTRILGLCLLCAAPFTFNHPLYLLPLFAAFLLLAVWAGAWQNLLKVGWLGIIFVIMSLVLWPFFYHGATVLYSAGPFSITREGVLFGLAIGIRLDCFLVLGIIFLTVTRLEDFTNGLTVLGVPYSLSFALGLAFRLTPLFAEEAERVVTAQKARGLDLDKGNLLARVRKHIPVIVPVLFLGLKKADQLSISLESKGFGLNIPRTNYQHYRWRTTDVLLLIIIVTLDAVLFWCGLAGYGVLS